MAFYTLAPTARQQFFDDSGVPVALGKLYTFAAGTTTALSTYQTSSGTAWGAFVQLDTAGRPQTGSIYLQPGLSYKFQLKDASGVTLWTQDGVDGVPASTVNVDIDGIAGQNLSAGDVVYMAQGTEGGTVAGSFYQTDATVALKSSDALTVAMVPSAIAIGGTGTMRLEGDVTVTGLLTPGAAYYASATPGAVTSTAPVFTRYIGQAKSTTVLTITPNGAGGGAGSTGLSIFQIESLLGRG